MVKLAIIAGRNHQEVTGNFEYGLLLLFKLGTCLLYVNFVTQLISIIQQTSHYI